MASLFKLRNVSNLKAMIWEDKKWTERKNIIPKKTSEQNNKEYL